MARHAAAAYLASTTASHRLCKEVDCNYYFDLGDQGTAAALAFAAVNSTLPEAERLTEVAALQTTQQRLSL